MTIDKSLIPDDAEAAISFSKKAISTLFDMEDMAHMVYSNVAKQRMKQWDKMIADGAVPPEGADGHTAAWTEWAEETNIRAHIASEKAWRSLARALMQMIRFGGHVTKDGTAALYGSSYIAYGVIPHSGWTGDNVTHESSGTVEWSVHA